MSSPTPDDTANAHTLKAKQNLIEDLQEETLLGNVLFQELEGKTRPANKRPAKVKPAGEPIGEPGQALEDIKHPAPKPAEAPSSTPSPPKPGKSVARRPDPLPTDSLAPPISEPSGESAAGDDEEEGEIPVEMMEGKLEVRLSPNRMEAWLDYVPPQGGKKFTEEDIKKALDEAGVVQGIDETALDRVLASVAGGQFQVAAGKSPKPGKDADFKLLYAFEQKGKPTIREDGTADFFELNFAETVEPGTPLMRREPPTPGEPGYTVTGEILPAKDGQNKDFAVLLRGAAVDPEDPDLIVATIGGQPKAMPNGVHVLPLLQIKNVDLSTGNIDFDGSVEIEGSVEAGFKVQAAGNIHVKGFVEAAELVAKGDIRIDSGVVGHAKAKLKAYGDIFAKFIESAEHVEAGGSIFVEEMVLHSHLVAFNRVMVLSEEGKGQIIGGTVQGAVSVEAKTIGAVSNTLTKVEAGTLPLAQSLAGVRMRRDVRKKAMAKSAPGTDEYDALLWDVEALTALEAALMRRIELAKTASIVAHHMVYGGVTLQVLETKRNIKADSLGASFRPSPDGKELLAGATLY